GVHLCRQHTNLARETVVHDDRRNGSREADRGGDERLRDARRNGLDARRGRGGEPHEGGHDTPDGAEEPDERRRARRGGEEREPTLEPGHLLRPGPLHGTLHGLDAPELRLVVLGGAPLRSREALQLLVAGPEDLGNRTRLHLAARRLDGAQVLRLPEDVDEARRLPPRTPHLASLGERDAPAADRGREQHQEHEADHPARAEEQPPHIGALDWQRLRHEVARLRGGDPETDHETQDLEDHASTRAGPRPPLHTTCERLAQGSRSVKSRTSRLDPASARWVYAKLSSGRGFSGRERSQAWRSVWASMASGESAGTCSAPAWARISSTSWR